MQNRSLDGDGAVNPDEMVSGGKEGGMSLFFPAQHTTWRTKQPVVDVVGTFDASRIALGSPLSRVPMDVYAPVTARAGDDASRDFLGDRELIPNSNVAGLLAQPASMLTTISALSEFSDYKGVTQAERDAPISVIRVRVDGSVGMDAASRERVDLDGGATHSGDDRPGMSTSRSAPRRRRRTSSSRRASSDGRD